MELYVAMVYDHVGTWDAYQSVRLSASTNSLAPMQTSMFKLKIKYHTYKYIIAPKSEHQRLHGCQICSSTQSDRLVCVPGAYMTIYHSYVQFHGRFFLVHYL